MFDIHVAVGVIRNHHDQVLIAKRPVHVHLGGLWEFPGGKLESGETVQKALQRELKEELNIDFDIANCQPLIKIRHHYPEKSVLLDVWTITHIQNQPQGNENQIIQWANINELELFDFPSGNKAIITALKLPNRYLITGNFSSHQEFDQRLINAIHNNIKLIQLRAHEEDEARFFKLAERAVSICHSKDVKILLNAPPELLNYINADGIHLSSARLSLHQSRPITRDKYLIASCHNENEIQKAININADAIVLGPVNSTNTHPSANPLGWQRFEDLVNLCPLPVFALGGLRDDDLPKAISCGAQGIAAISAWW